MSHEAPTDHPIHGILRHRWSPYAFDPRRSVDMADLRALFEAARWAMSSYNAQPWRYIVGVRDRNPALWEKVHSVLMEANQSWARNVPVLALGLVEHRFEKNGKENKAAVHDLGAASACLTFEATSRGLYVHQMAGIDPDKAREVFGISGSLEPFTALAIGYIAKPGDVDDAYAQRDEGPRERKPLKDIVISGASDFMAQ